MNRPLISKDQFLASVQRKAKITDSVSKAKRKKSRVRAKRSPETVAVGLRITRASSRSFTSTPSPGSATRVLHW
jgi:hypothetical protein